MYAVGIDPGASGAIAVYNGTGLVVERFAKRGYSEVVRLVTTTISWARDELRDPGLVWVEKVHSMPKQGVRSSFNFGVAFGLQIASVITVGVPWELVPPTEWMKFVRVPAMKNASKRDKLRARKEVLLRLVPSWSGHLDEVDAALISLAAWRQLRGEYGTS